MSDMRKGEKLIQHAESKAPRPDDSDYVCWYIRNMTDAELKQVLERYSKKT